MIKNAINYYFKIDKEKTMKEGQ